LKLTPLVPWDEFRPALERFWRKQDADRKSRAGGQSAVPIDGNRHDILTTPRQFATNRARRPVKKGADHPLTAAAKILNQNHATIFAAEVLASTVHCNILCPKG